MQNKSLFVLIIVNILPIFGVIFLDWQVGSIVSIYWVENIVIGIYNVLKIIKSENFFLEKSSKNKLSKATVKLILISFFIFHFGLFTLVHGVFIYFIFLREGINFIALFWGFVSLMISHGISYVENYLMKQEYKNVNMIDLMALPYKRVSILHMVVIFSGFVVLILSRSILSVVMLVFLKTVVDVIAHKKGHVKLQRIK
jgi:hypothetical protein